MVGKEIYLLVKAKRLIYQKVVGTVFTCSSGVQKVVSTTSVHSSGV